MKNILPGGLIEATRLTNAGRLTEATQALQRVLTGHGTPDGFDPPGRRGPPTIDGVADAAGPGPGRTAPLAEPASGARTGWAPFGLATPALPKTLGARLGQPGFVRPSPAPAAAGEPDGAQFLTKCFSNQAGSRRYKLYVPSGYRRGQPVPLVVMLHGCTQSPDDFAAGTRMNAAAEAHTCLVAYPEQTSSANMQKCWNWFSEGDQRRDEGEPSLIAGLTGEVMRDYTIDPRRIYVAGLSAGGAAAAIMGDAYPDLYAAIGVHSGLACGAARDMPSAFAAMQRGGATRPADGLQSSARRRVVPAIVFHGDRDTTVNPRNGEAVVAQSGQGAVLRTYAEAGQVPGGHAYSCTRHEDANGLAVVEQWVVHGAGHAWSGGSTAGSYTDPRGPDATGEMMRFFLEHPHPAGI
jgi:poly(hydroxyalkanoate) depolymerase family esterase